MDKIRIRMLKTVYPDLLFIQRMPHGTILRAGMEYNATSNRNGAISGVCDNEVVLGVKPGEFEFVEAPEWVLKIWGENDAL